MGNFRGKKPLFKWSCSHPWVEMQLQAWSTADDARAPRYIEQPLQTALPEVLATALLALRKLFANLSQTLPRPEV